MRPRLWIPESPTPPNPVVIEMPPIRVEGLYHVEVIDEKTGVIKKSLDFHNLITTGGLDALGTGSSIDTTLTTLAVGTGSTTPTTHDVRLVGEIARTTFNGGFSTVDTAVNSPVEYASRKRTRVFTGTQANGDLRELGFFSGSTLINRSLFKDAEGNPTTVSKTASDLLKIVYEYRIFAPLNDVTGTFKIGPAACSSVDYTIRPQNIGQTLGWLALLQNMGSSSLPNGVLHESNTIVTRNSNNEPSPLAAASTASFLPYTGSNFYRDIKFSWMPSVGNFTTNAHLVTWNPWFTIGKLNIWQMACTASIEKNGTNRLELTFRQRWTSV